MYGRGDTCFSNVTSKKRTGRSRHRGKKTLQGCTSTQLRLCYGVPCAVLVVVWSLFLLLTSTFSHSNHDHLRADIQQIKQPWRSEFWNEKSSQPAVGESGCEGFNAQQCPLPEAESVSFNRGLVDLNQNGSRLAAPSPRKEAQPANSSVENEGEIDTNRPHQNLEVQETGSLVGRIPTPTVELNFGEPDDKLESGGIGTSEDSTYLSDQDLSRNDDRASQLDGDSILGQASHFHNEFRIRENHNEPTTTVTDSGGCATEGCPKLCVVEEADVSNCHIQVFEGKTITPLWIGSAQPPEGLTCSDETTAVKIICDFDNPHGSSEKQPLDDFLLCLRDPLTAKATCEPLCSSPVRTTLTKSVSGVCLCRSPLLDIIVNRVPASPDANPRNSKLFSQLSLGASESEFLSFTGDLPESALLEVSNQVLGNEGAGIGLLTGDGIVTVGAEVHEGLEIQEGRSSRTDRVVSLDEYKRSVIDKKEGQHNVTGSDPHSIPTRHQHRDSGHNHADAAHGAKLVAFNKEAKGAGHILVFDKDKYLRNPCSAEDKFVVVELSEETLVDNIVLANFEFHSSNVKEFELLGSPDIYPTDEWMSLGKFEAENVRHAQNFTLAEPKWVRCLMLRLVSHYGAEFYCTLSMFQVHGVDAIELLLEDWIGEEGDSGARRSSSVNTARLQDESTVAKLFEAAESATAPQALPLGTGQLAGEVLQGSSSGSLDAPTVPAQSMHVGRGEHAEVVSDLVRGKEEDPKWIAGESFQDVVSQHSQVARPSGESLMKILMQKVKSLELNQSLFDGYLEDLNQNYREMFNGLDQDIASLTARLKSETATSSTLSSRLLEVEVKRAIETAALENKFVRNFQQLSAEIEFLRSRAKHMESRESLAVAVAILIMLVSPVLYLTRRCISPRRTSRYRSRSPSWLQQSQLYSRNHHQSFGFSYFLLFLISAFITLLLSV